jgi:hypothetical protein
MSKSRSFSIYLLKEAFDASNALSRISLMRAMKDMRRMGIEAEYCFIKDDKVGTVGKVKKRKPRTKKSAEAVEEAEFT